MTDRPPAVEAFLKEVVELCRKHGLSISHQDGQGAFEVDQFNERDANWLLAAYWCGVGWPGGEKGRCIHDFDPLRLTDEEEVLIGWWFRCRWCGAIRQHAGPSGTIYAPPAVLGGAVSRRVPT